MSFRVVKGDFVQVITGANKGVRGNVIEVNKAKTKVKVEGVAVVKKHQKPSQKNPQGGIVEKEAFIHISNVMIVDKKADAPTRIGAKIEDGKKVRVSMKSKEQL